uniref:TRASH domain-containing protein n=1 Tax=Denticeps clupeoides TaxID=299321 RepID=A0AAY4DVV6_9TELE
MDGDLEPRTEVEEGKIATEEEPEQREGEESLETTTQEEQAVTTDGCGGESVATATAVPKTGEDNDDDVVLVEQTPPLAQTTTLSGAGHTQADATAAAAKLADCAEPAAMATTDAASSVTPASPATTAASNSTSITQSEPIVIDDEEDPSAQAAVKGPPSDSVLSSTDPQSEIKIACVTTLGTTSSSSEGASSDAADTPSETQGDMNLMITSVTSLQGGVNLGEAVENGLQISSTFSLNPDAQQSQTVGSSARPSPTFNPGRVSNASQPVQNGETGTHQRPDSWISQSASFPRNQKQTGVDSPSPAASLPKPQGQSPSGSQQPPRTVKVTCANCKKPLKKGQTAYQRKGSAHLFCSTTCLSAFSHKPQPKKNCTMCKKDITSMKGTIVAQVDSSESFQEFCSTGCLGAYENKQNPPKSALKTKCTVCNKLTEIRHEVSFKNVTHKICSDSCFNRYRMANGLIMNCCEQCGNYLPSRATANHFLLIDGQQKRFCSQNCIRDYKQAHGKMLACSGCKTMCRSFDVTHCIGPSGTMEPYCSTTCMSKNKFAAVQNVEPSCHFCKRNALPQYQANLPEGKVLNFCSSQCVTKFQNSTVQNSTNGQTPSDLQLKCNYCRGTFSLKPEVLEWESKVYQFCSKPCCEDYKKLHCIVTFCEYCQEEKTLHETVKFSGVKKPFCSEGCKLMFKQDFARRLGLKCVTCNHCTQMCKRGVTNQIDGLTRDFCSDSCAKQFHDWYYKAARCDCCKVQGNLTESVQWRAEMKHFCDQQCLLRFYCQQNEPNMATQKGPENTALEFGTQTQGSKMTGPVSYAGGGLLKDVKNKAVLCKPLTMTKATYCKPHMQSKLLQTDEGDPDLVKKEYVPVPIPVPVYVPMPMNLYAQATPTPITLPVPVPVPFFLPTTLQNTEQIIKTIEELKAKLSSNLPAADLLTAGSNGKDEKPNCSGKEDLGLTCGVKRERVKSGSSSSSDEHEAEEDSEEEKYEPDLDLESDFPQASEPVPVLEGLDAEMGFTLPPVLTEEKEKTPRPRARRKGAKKQALEEDSSPVSPAAEPQAGTRSFPLTPRYGVNAWRKWASIAAQEFKVSRNKDGLSRAVGVKGNLLSLSASRLNQALSRFVKEVRRPNGERYSPDSILYLCLSVQKHLQDKGRTDDIFSDPSYQQFGEELNNILKGWQPTVLPDGSLWGRVQEQCLWESRQLGEESPTALLRSLVYLNTKYFGLRTVEQHLRLSFTNIYRPSESSSPSQELSVCIRIPSISQDHQEQLGTKRKRNSECETGDDPSASTGCPVKKHECRFYELYLSKCPASLRQRTDLFYLKPEETSSPESPLWFSSSPLDRSVLESVLTRVLLVKDIYRENHPEEEEEEED